MLPYPYGYQVTSLMGTDSKLEPLSVVCWEHSHWLCMHIGVVCGSKFERVIAKVAVGPRPKYRVPFTREHLVRECTSLTTSHCSLVMNEAFW